MADELARNLPERYILIQVVTQREQNPQTVLIPIAFDADTWDDALTRVMDQIRVAVYRAQAQHWRRAAGGES